MKQIRLITDGACKGNPGRGGWACILRFGEVKRELYGCSPHTTNNRMELAAAIEGLSRLKERCEVEVVTDSEYVKNGITKWINGWKRNGWRKADKQPVNNRDLWMALDELARGHQTKWTWTRGHSSHDDNNRCDELASQAAQEQIASQPLEGVDPTFCMQPASQSSGERICLFGGTFDPIHSAHLQIAEEAVEQFRLDRMLFVPAGTPPHKAARGVTPFADRLEMTTLACQAYPVFAVSRIEEGKGRSYTVDTVRRFRQTLPAGAHLFFLIGADAFDEIESWNHWRELVQSIEFIVVTRPGGSYHVPAGATVYPLNGLQLPVSSSDIRERLAAGAATPELPAAVRAFIDRRGLYRAKSTVAR